MLESPKTERQLMEQLLETLRALPDVHADLGNREPVALAGKQGHDAQIDLTIAGRSLTLLIEVVKAVYPRDVRQVLWQVKDFSQKTPKEQGADETLPLLLAESISPGAKDLLKSERIGYYDSGGSLYLPAHGAYLYIDRPPPKTMTNAMRTLFSGRRAQVLHTLLMRPLHWFSVKELAEQALVSPATASQVLTELNRFDWLISRGQGPNKERHLKEPAALLDAWVKQLASLRPPTLRRYYVPVMTTEHLLERIGQVFAAQQIEYAISHEAAAQRYAPFLSNICQIRCRLLTSSATYVALGELGARIVNEGANLVLLEANTPGELLFRAQVGGVWLASPIQIYLDLLRGEGRTKEMAEHLRKERIGY